ncbi:hypothetical protein VDG1235_3531 [Verrucomicrobiia bacterium DG1235]|nr:hypothetical protein VDG1235_3531 [Verrucomicrobiae bacterium DG1235]
MKVLAISLVVLGGMFRMAAEPAKPEVYQVEEGLYKGQFAVRVPVEPYLAYDLAWSLNLRDESWHSTGIQWQTLREEIGIIGPRRTPIFFRVNYHNAFAPVVVGDDLMSVFIDSMDGVVDIDSRGENSLNFSSTEIEEGFSVTLFGTILYQRTYLNDAEIVSELKSARVVEVSSGEASTFTISELASLSEEVLPEKLIGNVTFLSPASGTINFRTVYTDNSEGDFETVDF